MSEENIDFTPRDDYERIDLPNEMKKSFLDYAMSVIVSRALPDVRDGLKPVQRRILFGMSELGVTPDKPHKKSARIVGDVMGKYHPHGDSAIYEAMVRMAQDFSYREMLVDGHGNFGSVDGDGAAAMRYTESRMSKIALEMLRDINKDTIDFQDNYSQEEKEPVVLPARFPNLLVNGAAGIAVGMATNIPPHNLVEVINAVILLLKKPEASLDEIMEFLPGPDFPTGATIMGKVGIKKAYKTGQGKILVRSKVEIEELPNDRERIVITEIPYGVNKASLVKKIAELARDKKVEGITYANDESGREGMRIVVEVRRETSAAVVLNNLFKYTQLQTTFGMNMLAIDNGVPKILGLKEILEKYISHQENVITRRTLFEKRKAEDRAHILEGLRIALDHIDEIISIIRSSADSEIAKERLMSGFELTEIQSQAILDMRLVRLTGLERDKIEDEYRNLLELIAYLNEVLGSKQRLYQIIEDELIEIRDRFGNPRRTDLVAGEIFDIDDEDLIPEEDILIALTSNGYVKRMTDDEFHVQNRGGRGVKGMSLGSDDQIQNLVACSTHDTLLFFTNFGKVYRAKGFDIPEYGRQAKGLPIVNLINIDAGEVVKEVIAVNEAEEETGKSATERYLFFVTKDGTVKRSRAEDYFNIRTNGLIAINLKENDALVNVMETHGKDHIIIGTYNGNASVFPEDEVRVMGRTATGVRGIKLKKDDFVIGASDIREDDEVLVITENGYGKRTPASEYAPKHRGGYGVKTANISKKSGKLASLLITDGTEDLLIMTNEGIVIRVKIATISQSSRATLGVRVIRMGEGATVSSVTKIIGTEKELSLDNLLITESTPNIEVSEEDVRDIQIFDDLSKKDTEE